MIEDLFYDVIGGRAVSLRCKPTTFPLWSKFFFNERDNNVPILDRRAAFIAMWVSKYILVDLLCHTMKLSVFKLAIQMASRVRFPLAGMFLGTFYLHLDWLHEDEMQGGNHYLIESPLHTPFLRAFVWDRLAGFTEGQPVKYVRTKFCKPERRDDNDFGDFPGGFPFMCRWINKKPPDNPLTDALDVESNFIWRPYTR